MNQNTQTPYATLNPNTILDAIESIGFLCTGSLYALNSYENRVYQIGIEDSEPLIAKFYRPHRWSSEAILEEHQFSLELAEQEIPVIAPLIVNDQTLHHHQDFRFAVFPRRGGHALELDNDEQLEWMGRFIGRMHSVSASQAFQHRISLNIQSYGFEPYRFLMEQDFIPDYLISNFCKIVETALEKIAQIFEWVGDLDQIRLHGDCHAANILWRDSGPHIVDLDDCLMGPAMQDIWMLLSGEPKQMELQLEKILNGYYEFQDFNLRERHLIEVLRTLRMLHYSGWLAKRWDDPAFPLSFPWFNTPVYWENMMRNLNEQIDLLDQIEC
ncbi:kinase [Legionella quinlivanii]|uniref:Stress response kinase A n=1 Tax=Legionella quinlivanii TaxID=45073 RepID=A0A0W0XSY2_9GAMM|nr:serine/threonine protein kinase [Legionella quinlivanii]KTD47933.1 kinase [Legionella quinlivanii]SEG19332.1 Ser/Thr protein kinase RdoA involved in Cpx stress response, MazF antagonist [Legionella quinlivanii DSM 21216]STY11043.1 kinase [Legionella quinlivanii]